jgi:hypothetical protein
MNNERSPLSSLDRLLADFVLNVAMSALLPRHQHLWTQRDWWWVCDRCGAESLMVRDDAPSVG